LLKVSPHLTGWYQWGKLGVECIHAALDSYVTWALYKYTNSMGFVALVHGYPHQGIAPTHSMTQALKRGPQLAKGAKI
jgi:hypothetical protein